MFSNQDLFQDYQNLTKEKLNAAMQEAINRTRAHIPDFRGGFPSTASKNGIYQKTGRSFSGRLRRRKLIAFTTGSSIRKM